MKRYDEIEEFSSFDEIKEIDEQMLPTVFPVQSPEQPWASVSLDPKMAAMLGLLGFLQGPADWDRFSVTAASCAALEAGRGPAAAKMPREAGPKVEGVSHQETPASPRVRAQGHTAKHDENADIDALKKQLSALKIEVDAIKEANNRALGEREALLQRLEDLELKLEDTLAIHGPFDSDDEQVPRDPHDLWIEANLDELRKYPGSFVAIDQARGVVLHSADEKDFASQIEKLSPGEREQLMAFHTSMYI